MVHTHTFQSLCVSQTLHSCEANGFMQGKNCRFLSVSLLGAVQLFVVVVCFFLFTICLESVFLSIDVFYPLFFFFISKLVLHATLLSKICFKHIVYLYFIVFVISKGIYVGLIFWWPGIDHWWNVYYHGPAVSICACASKPLTSPRACSPLSTHPQLHFILGSKTVHSTQKGHLILVSIS